jgi:hypothetical protein
MASQSVITETALRVLKQSLLLHSFVVEEAALADLLQRAFAPIGKKIRKQLSGVVDFRTGRLSDKTVAFELWLTPEMFSRELEDRWKAFEPRVKKYLAKAYSRGWEDEGREPFTEKAAREVPVSQAPPLPKDDWAEVWQDFSREGSTLDPDDSVKVAAVSMAVALLPMLKTGFLEYAVDVVARVNQALAVLRQAHVLEKRLLEEKVRSESVVAEAVSKMDKELLDFRSYRVAKFVLTFSAQTLDAVESARQSARNALADILDGNERAALLANLSVARAHNFGFLDWAERNGVQYYKISSILDERVCEACLAMNGKIFSVSDGLAYKDRFLSAVGDKAALKKTTPFLTMAAAKGVQGVEVAKADEVYYFPPYHPGCRCKAIAVNDSDAPAMASETMLDSMLHELAESGYSPTKQDIDGAFKWYQGVGYKSINKFLRDPNTLPNTSVEITTRHATKPILCIDKAFTEAKMSNISLFRGEKDIANGLFKEYKILDALKTEKNAQGTTYYDAVMAGNIDGIEKLFQDRLVGVTTDAQRVFLSTSRDREVSLNDFAKKTDIPMISSLLHIEGKAKALKVSDFTGDDEEKELLLDRGLKFVVQNVKLVVP